MKAQLMTHIVAGYPTLKASEELALMMEKEGASLLEIQIPFSDPVADGKIIAQANQRALQNGVSVADAFNLAKRLSQKIKIPILLMSYFNIPFRYGLEKFCKKAKESGCYGLIIPDLPLDEEPFEHYLALCKKYKLHAIQVISPLTSKERLKKIAPHASGFMYCMSRTGITGESEKNENSFKKYLENVRTYTNLPLALGFGISKKEHMESAAKSADIIVIGSKIISLYNKGGIAAAARFLKGVVQYLHGPPKSLLQRSVQTIHRDKK